MIISQTRRAGGGFWLVVLTFLAVSTPTAPPTGGAGPIEAFERPDTVVTISHPVTGRLTRVLAGEILLKIPAGHPALAPLLQKYDLSVLDEIPEISLYRLRLPSNWTVPQALQTLANQPGVSYAEPQYLYHPADYFPNDPQLGSEWGLAKINAFGAWDLNTGSHGSSSIAVAVVDTGVDLTHPDLQAKILPGGYDFVDNDNDPSEMPGNGTTAQGDVMPDQNVGHGTEVAGVAAAATDNTLGIAGTGFNTRIFPVRIFPPGGGSPIEIIARGIIFAAKKPEVGVINLSLSGTVTSEALHDAVQYAYYNNKVVVAAAGNSPGCSGQPCYPAYYPEALSVAATDEQDRATSFTNYGSWVDIAAPGQGIASTSFARYPIVCPPYPPDNCHTYNRGGLAGTSFSAPFVSGVAALVRAVHPDWTPLQVMQHLEATGDDIQGGCGPTDRQCLIGPRLNANDAVKMPDLTPPTMLLAVAVQRTSARITFSEPLDPSSINGSSCSVTGLTTEGLAAADAPDTIEVFTSPQQGGVTYSVTCGGIKDTSGNTMTSQALTFVGTNSEVDFIGQNHSGSVSQSSGVLNPGLSIDGSPNTFSTASLTGGQPSFTVSIPNIQWVNRFVVRTGTTLVKYRLQAGIESMNLQDVAEIYSVGDASFAFSPMPIRFVRLIIEEAASGVAHVNAIEAYRDDVSPPVISNGPVAAPSPSGANTVLVTWKTDKLADSTVLYRPVGTPGWQQAIDSTLITDHAVTLSGISATFTYEYYVHSRDGWSNTADKPDVPDGEPPYTFALTPVLSITHQPPRDFAVIGGSIPVTLQATPTPRTVTLFYGGTCAGALQSVILPGTNLFTGAIPGPSVVFPGMSYYFQVVPFSGAAVRYPAPGCFNVHTTVAGDVNGDFVVDELDALEVALYFGETRTASTFSLNHDANGDGVVDQNDLAFVLQHFGETAH